MKEKTKYLISLMLLIVVLGLVFILSVSNSRDSSKENNKGLEYLASGDAVSVASVEKAIRLARAEERAAENSADSLSENEDPESKTDQSENDNPDGNSGEKTDTGSENQPGKDSETDPSGSGDQPGKGSEPDLSGGGNQPGKDSEPDPSGSGDQPGKDSETDPSGSGDQPGKGSETDPSEGGDQPGKGSETDPSEGGDQPGKGSETDPSGGGDQPGKGSEPDPSEGGDQPGKDSETDPSGGGNQSGDNIENTPEENSLPDSSNPHGYLLESYNPYAFDMKQNAKVLAQIEAGELSPWSLFTDSLFVGDSVTTGFDVYGFMPSGNVIATVGASIHHLGQNIDKIIDFNPSFVILHYGMNNLTGNIDNFISLYKGGLIRLKEALPDTKIFVTSLFPAPDAALDQRAFLKNIDSYNRRMYDMCVEIGVGFENSNSIAMANPGCFAKDGIHINTKLYKLWIVDIIRKTGIC